MDAHNIFEGLAKEVRLAILTWFKGKLANVLLLQFPQNRAVSSMGYAVEAAKAQELIMKTDIPIARQNGIV